MRAVGSIAILAGELESPRFRALYAYGGGIGTGVIWFLLRLICLAVESNRGGLIVRHSGNAMPLRK